MQSWNTPLVYIRGSSFSSNHHIPNEISITLLASLHELAVFRNNISNCDTWEREHWPAPNQSCERAAERDGIF
jgi:hypothetical protein